MKHSLLQLGRAGLPLSGYDIFDMHGHLGRFGFTIANLDPAALVADLNRMGVAAIVCSHVQTVSTETTRGNDIVAEAMRAFPGRILGYVTLHPACDVTTTTHEVEHRLDAGFIGIKLHRSNGYSYTDAGYEPTLALANERRLPVLLHTWGEACDFAETDILAERWPEAIFILAHAVGLAPALEGYTAVVRRHANVYLDTAMSRSPRGLLERYVEAVGVERIVYGSDALFYSAGPQIGKIVGARLSDAAKRAIFGGNARRILARARK